MTNKLLIIDGDSVAFRQAAGVETRSIVVKHLKSNREKQFKNRTEFKKFLIDKNFTFADNEYEITDHQKSLDISIAISNTNKCIESMLELTWCDDVEIYIGGGETFRHRLPLPSPYKDKRKESIKPEHLVAVRNHLRRKWKAKVVESGLEVDDVVTIRAYECLLEGRDAVLASVDKDSYQCQGVSLYNWTDEEPKVELIPDVGHLYKAKSTVKGNGLMFLAFQVLAGDPADTYQGYELSKVKYGATKAMNALKDCTTEQDILKVTISEFKRLYPEPFEYTDCHGVLHEEVDWFDMLNLFWACAYMKRSWGDPSSFVQFAAERSVYV